MKTTVLIAAAVTVALAAGCTGNEYETNKKNANEGVQTEYLNNGTYYVCVTDKVGNKRNKF